MRLIPTSVYWSVCKQEDTLPLEAILAHETFCNTVVWGKRLYAVHLASATTKQDTIHSFHQTCSLMSDPSGCLRDSSSAQPEAAYTCLLTAFLSRMPNCIGRRRPLHSTISES